MEQKRGVYKWLRWGRQKRAVITVLTKPKSVSEIRKEALKECPKIRLCHIRAILAECEKRNIASCLNPRAKTGRLYYLTGSGAEAREKVLSLKKPEPLDKKVDWELYSWIEAGRRKKIIFKVLGEPRSPLSKDTWKSPVEICTLAKKQLPPISLNATSDTLREFRKRGLITYCENENENYRGKRLYILTGKGKKIWEQMRKE